MPPNVPLRKNHEHFIFDIVNFLFGWSNSQEEVYLHGTFEAVKYNTTNVRPAFFY